VTPTSSNGTCRSSASSRATCLLHRQSPVKLVAALTTTTISTERRLRRRRLQQRQPGPGRDRTFNPLIPRLPRQPLTVLSAPRAAVSTTRRTGPHRARRNRHHQRLERWP
jgi:hypothetical protein